MKEKQMKRFNEYGVTLVALVVTIVIMLILAGVALNLALSDNGLISKTAQARSKYEIEAEREVISQNILAYQMEEMTEDSVTTIKKLGISLINRNMDNSDIWNIIVLRNGSEQPYGTDWNYIKEGTAIGEYGKANYNWVVNYKTGETILLEKESYDYLDSSSTVAVKDDMVFNFDSANLDISEGSIGQNAKLYYYDTEKYPTEEDRKTAYETYEKGHTVVEVVGYDRSESSDAQDYIDAETNAFKFNGNNYIEIYNESDFDFSKGFTYEFYGKIDGSVCAIQDSSGYCGLFGLWNGTYSRQASIRFGVYLPSSRVMYNLIHPTYLKDENNNNITESSAYGDWISSTKDPWNQNCVLDSDVRENDLFITVTFSPSNGSQSSPMQSVYINGEEFKSGALGEKYYNEFVKQVKDLHYLEIGRCTMDTVANWSYTKGLCYSIRMYNKALTEGQVRDNYKVTTAFHKYLTGSKN